MPRPAFIILDASRVKHLKRYGNLYPLIYDFDGLHEAYLQARKGKRFRPEVMRFTANLEENLIEIQNELMWQTYSVSPYRQFFIHEPKKRLIMALPFRDRVVQWSIYRILAPLLDKRYIGDSFACRVGLGTHKAVEKLQYWLRMLERKHSKIYVLKLDMTKYFYRVDHSILMGILERIVKDKKLLWLLENIIRCDHTRFGLSVDDTDFTGQTVEGVGMPIGNLTSQLFANLYLNELDQYVKHNLRFRHYMRYMDDALILHHDKKELWRAKDEIEYFLEDKLRLKLNDKTCVRTHRQGIDWVGFRVWPTHIKFRKTSALKMKRRLKHLQKMYKLGEVSLDEVKASVQSYLGILEHCNSYNLRQKVFGEELVLQKN